MDKEPEVNIIGLDDAFKKEHEQVENDSKEPEVNATGLDDSFKKEHERTGSDFDKGDDDKPRFFNLKKKALYILGAIVLIIIFVAFLSLGRIYLSESDLNALIKRVDRIEERLANLEGKTRYHVVARGESLSQIAGKYGLTVDKLRTLNKMTPSQTIHPGQKLLVSAVKGS
jgi:hypothetical protein